MPNFTNSIALVPNGLVTASGGQSRKVANCFAYHGTAFPTGARILAFIAAWEVAVWNGIAALLSTDYVGQTYEVYVPARIPLSPVAVGAVTPSGGGAGARLQVDLAVNCVLRTGLRGKNYRGLKRFGPVLAAHVTSDELNSTGVAAWSPAVATLTSTVTAAGGVVWTPFLLSRDLTDPHLPLTQVVGADLTSVTLNKTLGVSRHRRERTVR